MFKKATAFLTSAILGISAVALSCSVPVMAEDLSSFPAEPVKIGVEAFDTTDEQFMALQEYLDYLADNLNISFMYPHFQSSPVLRQVR